MTSASEYNFAYYLMYKNRATYFTKDSWFAQYYFTYIIYMCIYTHTYEYAYICILSIHLYIMMCVSLFLYTCIWLYCRSYMNNMCIYIYLYVYIYIYTYTHTYTYILWMHRPCPRLPCPATTSPPSAVRSIRHVYWQFSPVSSELFRTHRCSPSHQRYEVRCLSADHVLLTISWMKSAPYPFSPPYAPHSSSTNIYMMSVGITTLVTATVIANYFAHSFNPWDSWSELSLFT